MVWFGISNPSIENSNTTTETQTGTLAVGIRTLEKGRKKWLLEAPLRGLKSNLKWP